MFALKLEGHLAMRIKRLLGSSELALLPNPDSIFY
jgi:hypothetical protein